jgi:hypothetical protein
MGIGTSIFLIAVGAILRFAVTVTTRGFNLHTIGLILMIVGLAGLLISLFCMVVWADRHRDPAPGSRRDGRAVRDREYSEYR